MSPFHRLCTLILGLCVSVATSVLVCIHGWGLQPKSWWWIIGVYTIGNIIGTTLAVLSGKDD